VITAQTVLKMVDEGRLRLDDRVFGWFGDLRPPEGMREDPRLGEITIRMCLQHTGGWDRRESGDPSGWGPRIRRALRLERPPTPLEMIRYMKGVRLDFAPGTRQAYSNFGFVLLGAVIAAVAREEYPAFVQQRTLQPWGVHGMRVDEPPPNYFPGEARRYMLPAEHEVPGGNNRMVMAAGGWAANCVDMALMMTAIDGSRTGRPWLSPALMQAMVTPAPGIVPASPEHWMGLGWDQVERAPAAQPGGTEGFSWAKDGGLAGIQTWVQHLPGGTNFVLLFNSSVPHGQETPGALGLVRPRVLEFIRGMKAWPVGDLFAEFTRERA
jgi:N-acyl-D-amino-acid deacylase